MPCHALSLKTVHTRETKTSGPSATAHPHLARNTCATRTRSWLVILASVKLAADASLGANNDREFHLGWAVETVQHQARQGAP